jgi:hypothetical protein
MDRAGQGEPREAAGEAAELAAPEQLEDADVGEMLLVAYHARKAGCPRVQAAPEHIEALCLEVLRVRAAGKARS